MIRKIDSMIDTWEGLPWTARGRKFKVTLEVGWLICAFLLSGLK